MGNYNDLEAEIVESILRQLDIPVLKKYPDSGGYMEIYTGLSHSGVSLYVPEAELERAREAVENHPDIPDYPEKTDEVEPEEEIEAAEGSVSILGILRFVARVAIIAFFLYYLIIYLFQLF